MKKLKVVTLASGLLLFGDIKNVITNFINSQGNNVFFVLLCTISIVIVLIALELDILKSFFKRSSINFVDQIIIILILICIVYYLGAKHLALLNTLKLSIVVTITGICILGLVFRSLKYSFSLKKSKQFKSNVFDLKEIYEGNLCVEKEKPILIDGSDVHYDLLKRDKVINHLYNLIDQSHPNGKFVMSLEGKWGSGKTTILNMVKGKIRKENSDIIIIDEFDPWNYGNQEKLFENMFSLILRKSGYNYSNISVSRVVESLSENVFGSKRSKLLNLLLNKGNDVNSLKDDINTFLKLNDKKIVFFIDNIDRTESNNVLLLFRLLSNVFDFQRITYVLSFDDERVKHIFENKKDIDYKYLKKVIQLQVRIPEPNKNVLEKLFNTCIENLLEQSGEGCEKLESYNPIISHLVEQRTDMRDFKVFINSAINNYKSSNYLNLRDFLIIEYIKLFRLPLYQSIFDNREYYISHDKMFEAYNYRSKIRLDSFDEDGKKYFNNLFSEEQNSRYIDLLSEAFPYVENHKTGLNLTFEKKPNRTDPEYLEIAKTKSICSAKYFDLYFTNTENEFTVVSTLVENFLINFKELSTLSERNRLFISSIVDLDNSWHKEVFERLELYVEDLSTNESFDLVQILIKNIHLIDNTPIFISINAYSRTLLIVWELIKKLDNKRLCSILTIIKSDYSKLGVISSILNFSNTDEEDFTLTREVVRNFLEKMGNKIINEKINLYLDENYAFNNIWGLYFLYKEDLQILRDYIKSIISESNIYRIIYDTIGISVGSDYTYYIKKLNLEFLTTEYDVNNILSRVSPSSEDEQFVLDIYNAYLENDKNIWGESGITTTSHKVLTL